MTNGIIDFTEAGQLLYRPVREYSVGMHARLVLGLALYINPELVVIDDVLSMLDQTFFEAERHRNDIHYFRREKYRD